jgi:exopolysaccharide biosynthesis polyprenyl glycosylphosphotransferase
MSVFEASGAGLSVETPPPGEADVITRPSAVLTDTHVVDLRERAAPATRREQSLRRAEGPRRILARYARWARFADLGIAGLAALGAVTIRLGHTPGQYLLLPVLLPLTWVFALWVYRGYEHRFIGDGPEEYHRVVHAGVLLFSAVAVSSYILSAHVSRTVAMISVPCTLAGTLISRRLLRAALRRARKAGRGLHRTLVVGRADAVVSLITSLRRTEPHLHHGVVPVGVCLAPEEVTPSRLHDVPVLGTPDDVVEAVDAVGADTVAVVSHPGLTGHALRKLSWALEERDVELLVSPGIVEVAGPRISIRPLAGLSLLHLERPVFRGSRRVLKRVFDYLVASGLIAVLSPLLIGLAVLIRTTSRGPALFRQTRVGTDGRLFTVYKFRSMVVDAEARRAELLHRDEGNGVLFKMRTDPRVTRIGNILRRYSLDELPQLLNVLRGNMSLVGPRPPLPVEVAGYSTDEVRRLRVRPGMTGLWQVSGRSDLTWEESLRLDLRYVDNWSISLDLTILWRTVRAVAQGSGAY